MAGKPHQTKIDGLLGNETALRGARRFYQPQLCPRLGVGAGSTRLLPGFDLEVTKVAREQLPFVSKNELLEIVPDSQPGPGKPMRLGVVLSGGPAPGGHNVIAGLFHAAKRAHPDLHTLQSLLDSNPELRDPQLHERYWSDVHSDDARARWVEPDLASMP